MKTLSFLLFFLCSCSALSQGYYSHLLVLDHQPSAFLNALGDAGVALPSNDAFTMYANPAHTALQTRHVNAALSAVPQRTFIANSGALHQQDTLNAFACYAGYDWNKSYNLPLCLSIGFGRINTSGRGYSFNCPFLQKETALLVNASAAYTFSFMTLSAGASWKPVTVTTEYPTGFCSGKETINEHCYDFGLLTEVPLITRRIGNATVAADARVGYSVANIGDIQWFNAAVSRVERIGYSAHTVVDYHIGEKDICLVDALWSVDARAYLVKDYRTGEYPSVLSSINIINDVLQLGKFQGNENVFYGVQARFANTFSCVYGANSLESTARKAHRSWGIGIHAKGVFDVLDILVPNSITAFCSRHLDISYHYAETRKNDTYTSAQYKQEYHTLSLYYRGLEW